MQRLIAAALVLCALNAQAQIKVSGKLTCAKPIVNAMEPAQDVPGHLIGFAKANCSWDRAPVITGMKARATFIVEHRDVQGSALTTRGYSGTVYGAADSAIVRYEGGGQVKKDGSGELAGKWTYVRGTGKLRGIQGGGTYKGTGAADGSSSVEVVGEYTLAAGRTP